MSLANELDQVAADFETQELNALLEQFVSPPAPSWGVRSAGGASTPLTAAEVMANAGGLMGMDLGVASLTGIELADESIETEHLSANVVVANVINVSDTVTIDSTGITITEGALIFEDSYGVTVLTGYGFFGGWLDFLSNRTYNGGFRGSPPTPGSDITTGEGSANQLPNFVFIQSSGTKVTARWIADTGVGSGGMVKLSMAGSGAGTDAGYLEAIVPIMSSRSQDFSYDAVASFYCPVADMGTAASVLITTRMQYLMYDAVTPTGSERTSAGTLGGVQVGINSVATFEAGGDEAAPPDAGYARIRIWLERGGAANAAAGAIYLTTVRLVQHDFVFRLVDVADPSRATFTVTKGGLGTGGETWFQTGSDFWLFQDEDSGDLNITASGTLNLVGDSSVTIQSPNNIDLNGGGGTAAMSVATSAVFITEGTLAITTSTTPASLGGAGTTSNYSGGDPAAYRWYLSSSGARDLTGIVAGFDGERHLLVNNNAIGGATITIKMNVTSTAANRFTGAGDIDIPVRPHGAVEIMYDGSLSRWLFLNDW